MTCRARGPEQRNESHSRSHTHTSLVRVFDQHQGNTAQTQTRRSEQMINNSYSLNTLPKSGQSIEKNVHMHITCTSHAIVSELICKKKKKVSSLLYP